MDPARSSEPSDSTYKLKAASKPECLSSEKCPPWKSPKHKLLSNYKTKPEREETQPLFYVTFITSQR